MKQIDPHKKVYHNSKTGKRKERLKRESTPLLAAKNGCVGSKQTKPRAEKQNPGESKTQIIGKLLNIIEVTIHVFFHQKAN